MRLLVCFWVESVVPLGRILLLLYARQISLWVFGSSTVGLQHLCVTTDATLLTRQNIYVTFLGLQTQKLDKETDDDGIGHMKQTDLLV